MFEIKIPIFPGKYDTCMIQSFLCHVFFMKYQCHRYFYKKIKLNKNLFLLYNILCIEEKSVR